MLKIVTDFRNFIFSHSTSNESVVITVFVIKFDIFVDICIKNTVNIHYEDFERANIYIISIVDISIAHIIQILINF